MRFATHVKKSGQGGLQHSQVSYLAFCCGTSSNCGASTETIARDHSKAVNVEVWSDAQDLNAEGFRIESAVIPTLCVVDIYQLVDIVEPSMAYKVCGVWCESMSIRMRGESV
jgi:hypothetical protein